MLILCLTNFTRCNKVLVADRNRSEWEEDLNRIDCSAVRVALKWEKKAKGKKCNLWTEIEDAAQVPANVSELFIKILNLATETYIIKLLSEMWGREREKEIVHFFPCCRLLPVNLPLFFCMAFRDGRDEVLVGRSSAWEIVSPDDSLKAHSVRL